MLDKIISILLLKSKTFRRYMDRIEYLESRVANDYKEIKDITDTVADKFKEKGWL
jgi:hypothetical protein